MEEWRDIKGSEGFYQVSNMGRVRSLDRDITTLKGWKMHKKGCVLKHGIETRGYSFVSLRKPGTVIYARVHRLVADAFMTNEFNKPEVNHIDGNKQNNAVTNLEYSTHSENMRHAVETGLKKRAYPVEMLDANTGEVLRTFPSMTSASKYFNKNSKSPNGVLQCIKGKYKTAYGYKWRRVSI